MNTAEALVLGILQGVTEWLPISSEGQTMLAMIAWLGISPSNALSYSIFLHLGTMAAVLLRFRREFLGMIEADSKLRRIVLVSTLCTCFTGVPLYLLQGELHLRQRGDDIDRSSSHSHRTHPPDQGLRDP